LQAEVVAAGDSNNLAPTEAGELRVKVHTLEKLQARLKKEEKQLEHAEALAEKAHKIHGTINTPAREVHARDGGGGKSTSLSAELEAMELQSQWGQQHRSASAIVEKRITL
jgi:hypothetical protein